MINFGIVKPGSVLEILFETNNAAGASITLTGLAVTDIEIYKDGSMTQRGSDSGYALLDSDGIDLDGITGIQGFTIDLADNTTAGFYASGSRYYVVVSAVTVDTQTVNFVAGAFRIGLNQATHNTTIATLATQTSFTLTAGPAEDNALNGCRVYIHDVASAVQSSFAVVLDYTGATKTVELVAAPTYTVATTDNIAFFPPTDAQTVIDAILAQVATATELVEEIDASSVKIQNIIDTAGDTWNAIDGFVIETSLTLGLTGNTTTQLHLDGLTYADDGMNSMLLSIEDVSTGMRYSRWIEDFSDTGDLATVATLPFTPEAGVDVYWVMSTRRDVAGSIATGGIVAGSFAAGAIDATAIAANAITDAKVASDVTIASVTGAVGSVTGAVGSVTGLTAATVHSDLDDIQTRLPAALVSGRIDASVGAMAANVLTATAINADAITDAKVASDVTIASVTGAVGSVTGAVGSVTGLTAATVHSDLDDIQARLPAALTANGNIKADTLRIAGTVQTAGDVTADSAAILVDTVEIGAAGAGLTAINLPNQTMDIVGNITGNLSGSVGSVTGAVGSVTGSTAQTGDSFARIGTAGAGLTAVPWNATWDAEVESEVNDAIDTVIAELGVAAPTATPTLRTGMMLMYMALRNKLVVQTSGTDAIEIYNNAGTKIAAKAITDDGSDYTEAEMA